MFNVSLIILTTEGAHPELVFHAIIFCVTDLLTFCVESSIIDFTLNTHETCCHTVFAIATSARLCVGFTFRCL